MKKMIKEHATRLSHIAAEYSDSQDSDEYRACTLLVVHYVDPSPRGVVFDLGTGTGAIALALTPDVKRVVGRDISEGMLEQVRTKATEVGIENAEFDEGRLRDPNVDDDEQIDTVVTNFAMYHLSDEERHEAIGVITDFEPRRFVLGDVMFFGTPDPDEPFYPPEVDDPVTVGFLADALTDARFVLTTTESAHEQVDVLVAERAPTADEWTDPMKHLPKYLRPRRRYLAVEIEAWPGVDLARGPFQRELWYAAQNLYGDAGSADADLTALGFDYADGVAETIVHARHGHVEDTRVTLACIDAVGGGPVGVRVRGVSGIVRAYSERYLHGRAGISEERAVVFENDSRTAVVRDSLFDVRGSDGFTGATQLDFE